MTKFILHWYTNPWPVSIFIDYDKRNDLLSEKEWEPIYMRKMIYRTLRGKRRIYNKEIKKTYRVGKKSYSWEDINYIYTTLQKLDTPFKSLKIK